MKDDIKNNIIGFSVYNQNTKDDKIIWIGLELCKKYGWNTEDIVYYETHFDPVEHCQYESVVHNKSKAWN